MKCALNRRILSLFALLGVVSWAHAAHAYTYYVSDLNGVPVRWFKNPVEIKISTVEPMDVSWLDLDGALRRSMETWNAVDQCTLPLLVHSGTTDVTIGEAPEEIDAFAENTVLPIHSPEVWSSKGYSSSLLAITSLTYDRQSGVLVDADIEINDWNHIFSSQDSAVQGANDLENTLTHEIGHLLGMDHSEDVDATMYGQAPDAEDKKRTLENDDVDGVCDLYKDYTIPDTASLPEHNHVEAHHETSSCASFTSPSPGFLWLYGGLVLVLLGLRSSRRSQESR